MLFDIEKIYIKYSPLVFRRCVSLLRDEDLAEDAMQDTFVQVLRYQEKLEENYTGTLLYKIATNVCLNIIREREKKKLTNDEKILNSIAFYDQNEKKIEVENMLNEIFENDPLNTRYIAVLRFIDKMTLKETAHAVGMSVSGVRKRLRELKNRIQNLKELYYE